MVHGSVRPAWRSEVRPPHSLPTPLLTLASASSVSVIDCHHSTMGTPGIYLDADIVGYAESQRTHL